jgi:fatty-acyl-CoA synthase
LVDLRVVDENMREVPHDGNATGEVVARAPWATQGYLNNRQASEQLWTGGYLHSQDIGNIDEAGYLQITDRMKDVIKSGGEWISSLELEDLISRHAKVSEAAVFAVKDEKWGERPMALVVPKLEYVNAIAADEIRAHVTHYAENGTISRYAVPERILIVAAIEKTSVGKMNKKLLREKYGVG